MNETLEGIRQNTGEGAKAMSAASNDLRQAGEAFRQQLEGASRLGSETAQRRIEASGEEIARLTREVTENASKRLLSPLESIAQQLGVVVAQVEGTSSNMRSLSEGVRAGADASLEAAGSFRSASQELVNAATPVRATSERIEGSIRQLEESTKHVSTTVAQSAKDTANSAREALGAASVILSEKAGAIQGGLTSLSALLERFKGQGDRLDDMDEKLGRAFETYTEQVARAVDSTRSHVNDLQRQLTPALDTLQAVVDRAEQFIPQSRR